MDKLLEFLSQLVTDERKEKIELVLAQRTLHFQVVVEDTYQEHNAGAIVRSCDCFGIQKLSVIQHNNAFNVAHGMASGAEKWIDIEYFHEQENGIASCINKIRNDGYQIVATTPLATATKLEDFDITKKSALFFGREREGLSPTILEQADACIQIPMVGFTASLNISVSLAIILHHLKNQLDLNGALPWKLTDEENYWIRLDWYYKSMSNNQRTLLAFLHENPDIDQTLLKKHLIY